MGHVKKVGIVHYRAGRTDGVSLEIEKRKTILASIGIDTRIISGAIQHGSDFIIDELEFDIPEIIEIKENSFKFFKNNTLSTDQLMRKIQEVSLKIEEQFMAYYRQEMFDALLVHNIFCFGLHLPAALAFTRIARNLPIPVISTNHDYYWEREEYLEPANESIRDFMNSFVPPPNSDILHISINSLAADELRRRRDIDSLVIPDIFDFKQPPWERDEFNADFLSSLGLKENDLIVLQATRIIERKGIEIAIQFVKKLQEKKNEFVGKRLYNGKVITGDSDVVFVLAGYAEKAAQPYLARLKHEAGAAGIRAKFIHENVAAERVCADRKTYSLWDCYVHADLVTYPSLVEGWGNQFIEAVFAKKPIVLFEYPVFEKDIKPEGYAYISLGSQITSRDAAGLVQIPGSTLDTAVDSTLDTLTSPLTPAKLDENFVIGEKYHDFDVIKHFFINQFCKSN